jgi:hypothetical protein
MYFNDEIEKKPKTKLQIWLPRLITFTLSIAVLFLLSLTIMGRIDPKDDALKKGVERLMAQVFEGDVGTIKINHGISIYPFFRVHAENGAVYKKVGDEGRTVMSFDTLMFSSSFWQIFRGKKSLEGILVKNLFVPSNGYFLRDLKDVHLDLKADQLDGQPAMKAEGLYGDQPFTAYLGLGFKRVNMRPVFYRLDPTPLELIIKGYKIQALHHQNFKRNEIEITNLENPYGGALHGKFDVVHKKNKQISTIQLSSNDKTASLDVIKDGEKSYALKYSAMGIDKNLNTQFISVGYDLAKLYGFDDVRLVKNFVKASESAEKKMGSSHKYDVMLMVDDKSSYSYIWNENDKECLQQLSSNSNDNDYVLGSWKIVEAQKCSNAKKGIY